MKLRSCDHKSAPEPYLESFMHYYFKIHFNIILPFMAVYPIIHLKNYTEIITHEQNHSYN